MKVWICRKCNDTAEACERRKMNANIELHKKHNYHLSKKAEDKFFEDELKHHHEEVEVVEKSECLTLKEAKEIIELLKTLKAAGSGDSFDAPVNAGIEMGANAIKRAFKNKGVEL